LPPHSSRSQKRLEENIVGAVSFGLFLILVGITLATTPDVVGQAINFAKNITVVQVPGANVKLPAPSAPAAYASLYAVASQFALGVAVLLVLTLIIRFVLKASVSRKAENVGSIVFWLGASGLISAFLNEATTLKEWFMFWSAIVALVGASMVARAIVIFALKRVERQALA
jgi:hypothetical protein